MEILSHIICVSSSERINHRLLVYFALVFCKFYVFPLSWYHFSWNSSIYIFLKEGESYVCSSDMKFCKMDYKRLSKLPTWIRKDWIRKDYCAPKRQKSEPIKCSTVVHKRASESDEKKFLRPRIITVMNGSEIRPRKFIQILLNHKTAPSLDRVMATIDCGLKLNSGTVKRLFRVDGTLVNMFGI